MLAYIILFLCIICARPIGHIYRWDKSNKLEYNIAGYLWVVGGIAMLYITQEKWHLTPIGVASISGITALVLLFLTVQGADDGKDGKPLFRLPEAKPKYVGGTESFDIDRMTAPLNFYTPIKSHNRHDEPIGTVFAESAKHSSKGWICVGYVSKQTPFGQGIFIGFPITELRRATPKEVQIALSSNHPHGMLFRPKSEKASDASFHMIMSQAIGNWTNDNTHGHDPIINVSRNDLQKVYDDAVAKHREIMEKWGLITKLQRDLILKTYK